MKSGDHAALQHHVVAPSKVFVSDHLSSSDALLSFKSLEVADPNPISTLSALQLVGATKEAAAPNLLHQLLDVETQVLRNSDFNSFSVVPYSNKNSGLLPPPPSCDIPGSTSTSLQEFIATISEAPEPPLIRSPPNSNLVANIMVGGNQCSLL